ncbi:hypothetical protein [Bythopirellula goksoeyrii]|uniref:Uncharacterized protein n=1 Tax=Bythopirellula goksoeyrii TaxID=1400387 RepID=A0A5B9QEC1_9BACT|nr:hypothetical protein [Bythopirellula goksoeyrii]QEG35842.1 hypothetical protein Pr1d_31480 [Bythopirellula goksoeyrii]
MISHQRIRSRLLSAAAVLLLLGLLFPTAAFNEAFTRLFGGVMGLWFFWQLFLLMRQLVAWFAERLGI